MQRYAEAERTYQRAFAILDSALGPDHPDIAMVLLSMAETHRLQGRYEEAEPLLQRASVMVAKTLGPEHPVMAGVLSSYAQLLRATKRKGEAAKLEQRAQAIVSGRGQENPGAAQTVDYWELHRSIVREPSEGRP
jgi:tetratricopeptide (TPR) repeat protein